MNEAEVVAIYQRADVYDAIYRGRGKNYEAEAAIAIKNILHHNPTARSLVDVACGTGLHLAHFAEAFPDVSGVDLTPEMMAIARSRLPEVPIVEGDMRDLRLGRRYDAVTCMFGSIGYLVTTGELDSALASFARHLRPGGVVVVEPWWSPDTFTPGHVGGEAFTVDGRTLARVSHTEWEPGRNASRMEVHYLIAEPSAGIGHFRDLHVMTLFSREEYRAAFTRAGLSFEFVGWDQAGPGLLVGVLGAGA